MRALIQRVSRACVSVDGGPSSTIGRGMVILLGVGRGDDDRDRAWLVEKSAHLRVFEDDRGKMNRSLLDVNGEALVISQFTLYGDTRRGRRPGFSDAAPPEAARAHYEAFVDELAALGVAVRTGSFGARMAVEIHNEGPVTLMLESPGKAVA